MVSETSRRIPGGSTVAVGMMTMNVTIYAFNIVAARVLVPQEFGAITALFGIILVGTVAALGLQAATARRLAVSPDQHDEIVAATVRVTLLAGLAVGVLVALSTIVLTPALKLGTPWPVVLCGAALVPLTLMGGQCGIAQGTRDWGALTAIYAGNGIGRLTAGTVALLISPTTTSAMVGIAVGSWLPVLAGARTMRGHLHHARHTGGGSMVKEALFSTHALLAFFVLSNMDSLIARNRFDAHASGLYASGLILAKAALYFPQFVSVVVFPDLAQATTNHARFRAAAVVAGFGGLAVAATAVLPSLALILVGGHQYEEISGRLWLFALAGSLLATVNLLVLDALARHAHGIVVLLWTAVAAVAASAYGLDVGITGLVVAVAAVSGVLATLVSLVPLRSRAPDSVPDVP